MLRYQIDHVYNIDWRYLSQVVLQSTHDDRLASASLSPHQGHLSVAVRTIDVTGYKLAEFMYVIFRARQILFYWV